jgi:hypothetical protein
VALSYKWSITIETVGVDVAGDWGPFEVSQADQEARFSVR